LGLAVSPGHATDGLVYVFYNTGTESRIARFRTGAAPEVIVSGIPAAQFHTGGRIAFGPDGRLYATVGDATDGEDAQDPESLAGKILRFDPDGSIPPDNPDPASAVWSLGHRNVEGLTWDADGRLWATEFGEAAIDELNLIEPGGNYGWPRFEGPGRDSEFIDPLVTWTPAEASPAGITFAAGDLWVAALRGERLWRVPLPDGRTGTPLSLLEGRFGRLRTVELAPDGSLWIMTSNRDGRGEPSVDDDRIIRISRIAAT
jgi:glucose/arabinose dehydrogenase